MEPDFLKYVHANFANLIEKHGFNQVSELNDGQSFEIEYCSDFFGIKIQKYRREFYVILYKVGISNNEVDLFNLLSYLYQNSPAIPESKYFHDEKDINESFRKQITYIIKVISDNFIEINNFFNVGNYELNILELEKFMLRKYPELFKK